MGLRSADLKDLIDHIFEVDSYASKMGEDKDIVTLSFSMITKESADDLVNFIEKGYSFVLDADATAGEQSDGTYKVFVEIERSKDVPEQIMEIMDGVSKITGKDDFKFRYYKSFRSLPVSIGTLKEIIPADADSYGIKRQESNLDNYKTFFSNSYVEDIEMHDDIITVQKKYADPLNFKFIDFGNKKDIRNNIQESFDINAYPEILFLTKYLGDYNISKYGENLFLEHAGKTLVVRRL